LMADQPWPLVTLCPAMAQQFATWQAGQPLTVQAIANPQGPWLRVLATL
jgi:hypothetical protein